MASGLLVYPFGLNSSLVKSFCGDSDIYYAGECQIGWGYMLAIVGVMLTLFLPFFANGSPSSSEKMADVAAEAIIASFLN
ncbi:hypothetical protein SRHO_G00288490 [Serrasalmus rhombeus]